MPNYEEDPEEFRVKAPHSSSDIVVRGASYGMEVTLDPMVNPVRKIDVYQEEAPRFVEAVLQASLLVEVEDDEVGELFGRYGLLSRVQNLLSQYRERLAEDDVNEHALDALDSDIERFEEFVRHVHYREAGWDDG